MKNYFKVIQKEIDVRRETEFLSYSLTNQMNGHKQHCSGQMEFWGLMPGRVVI